MKEEKGNQHEILCSTLESKKHGHDFWILSLVYCTKSSNTITQEAAIQSQPLIQSQLRSTGVFSLISMGLDQTLKPCEITACNVTQHQLLTTPGATLTNS